MEDFQNNSSDSERIPYFIPRRPRVVKMRDLSPATREHLTREYFDAYDPWTGIRIAATLGLLISLFTLFLVYKSRFHRARHSLALHNKKTSLYLYEEDLGSSSGRSSYGLSFPEDIAGFQLEEVYVKSSQVVAALKVKRGTRGPKFGTLRITEDASRSLPCSPLKGKKAPSSASIASFEGEREGAAEGCTKHGKRKKANHSAERKRSAIMVVAKKPQDYRSRSTIVSIARRQRTS